MIQYNVLQQNMIQHINHNLIVNKTWPTLYFTFLIHSSVCTTLSNVPFQVWKNRNKAGKSNQKTNPGIEKLF